MKTQTIEVEVPDGYRVADYKNSGMKIILGIKKIQPHRIVIEETDEDNSRYTSGLHETQFLANGDVRLHNLKKKWREVKETDIPLTNEEHYLKLTKKDMLELIEHIKLGGQLNHKIAEFIKENS